MRPLVYLLLCACVLTTCLNPRARPPAAHLIETAIDPPAAAPDRTARLPTVTLAFDQPLAPPGDDAVWLLAGEPTPALRTAAGRGALTVTDAMRRLEADIALDPDDPTRLRVRPRAPLLPETPFVVATTVRLTTVEGAPVFGADRATYGPAILGFAVAPVRACPPLARVAFPIADALPTHASRLVVAFDRAVLEPAVPAPLATLVDPAGNEAALTAALGCRQPGVRGGFCLVLTLAHALEPDTPYTLTLGALADDADLAPQPGSFAFHTLPSDAPRWLPPEPAPVVCATDELARPPYCVRVFARGAIEVRGVTRHPGALRVTAAGRYVAESPVGVDHVARVAGLLEGARVPLRVATVAVDGTPGDPVTLEPVDTPLPLPRVRITEVLARPASTSAQEFVELLNEGASPVSLAGLALVTSSGRSALPAVTLAPGARAVVVGPMFDPRGAPRMGDPAVAPGTVLARTAATIAGRGLADRGVDVWIAGPGGHVISRAPLGGGERPPRVGVSVVRADERMKEDDPVSWSYDALGGSTPGLPDQVR